ncbi:hypothetical protein M9H77_30024 [Catharanthus roseus]|uniref:Uncharacterized protein n=1 Tax=Catharanthus roseus TaxID=4058 RepID=A0ACB9ZXE3_CATRO|nr:hypothetical protein M9H77_30024 [Catharanthus roseus]
MFGAASQDSSCRTHGYSHVEYGVSSSVAYVLRPADRVCKGDIGLEGDSGVGEEQERVRSLHIEREVDERGDDDDDGDGGDDDQDEGDDARDDEQPVPVVPMAHASGSDGRPRHRKGKGLTRSFMSVMSKFVGSRNKRPEVAREVSIPTQKRKKVKPSDWEQTEPAEGGLVDPELIPSYGGHVARRIWRGHNHGSLKFQSRYMALTRWELTDAHVRPLASGSSLTHLRLCMFQHPTLHCCRPLLRGGSPTRIVSTCHRFGSGLRLSREQLLRLVQDDLDLALTGSLGFNIVELHAVATNRQTSLSPRDASSVGTFAWAAACLVYLYRNLDQASRVDAKELAGYRTRCRRFGLAGFPPQALLDLIAREASREDLQDSELGCMVQDLLRKHYRAH